MIRGPDCRAETPPLDGGREVYITYYHQAATHKNTVDTGNSAPLTGRSIWQDKIYQKCSRLHHTAGTTNGAKTESFATESTGTLKLDFHGCSSRCVAYSLFRINLR